ncbi:hypothetical protein R3P38DRAFT_2911032 [Favolaschia claudopus]|uniref:EF-hand domain-containing protein n=1 Tax=Favolaschia claudopus TaxID=2862362 RepID=A0AAW0CAP3_9AGAR
MSTGGMFPKRGRRENSTADESFVDLEAPRPISEKRHHSPFSYLRIRKRSTEGPKKSPPPPTSPLPSPPSLNHNRNYSDPRLINGAVVYPQRPMRSQTGNSSNESSISLPTSNAPHEKHESHWDTSADNILPVTHALLPTPTPMFAAAAMITASANLSQSPRQYDGFPSASISTSTKALVPTSHPNHSNSVMATLAMDKAKVTAAVGPLITVGMQNLTKAQTVMGEVVASEAYSVIKENVTAVLAPAKDVVQILDSVTKYVPVLMVAESVFSVIIQHELERHENDKNILVVYNTMTVFWFTMCDLKAIFRADEEHIRTGLQTFFQAVSQTMHDFGNFREVYYKHHHFARALRSSEYRKKLAGFSQAFVDHKASLQFILNESSALQINDISEVVNGFSAKMDAISAKLGQAADFLLQKTPLELSVLKQVEENGGQRALEDSEFLDQLARAHGMSEISLEEHASLQQGLEEALSANMPKFTLRVEAAQKEISDALERTTEAILQQLNAGPYQLIKDEDIKAVWQSILSKNWRISCKARHFVDAVHNHFAQQFGEHQQTSGEVHRDQWTLSVLTQVIYYPNIADAIDDDSSGYISVHEVNRFFKSRPKEWSAVEWLSYWAVGWKQNALAYNLFSNLEASARVVLPQNRRCVKSYIKTSGLSELWLVVNSLAADLPTRAARHMAEIEPLSALRAEMMSKEAEHVRSRLERIHYQLDTPDMAVAVLGTHRLEGFILCFLELILERHLQVIQAANTYVISDREFDTMTLSLRNLVAAFSSRYQTLAEGWKQQRLDTSFLVQCFAGGMFKDWHEVFQDQPTPYTENAGRPTAMNTSQSPRPQPDIPLENILLFPLPPQPSPRGPASDEWSGSSPPRRLATLPQPQGPRWNNSLHPRHNRNSVISLDYFYHFDFERRPSELSERVPDPASISDVYRKSTAKKPKLEDRISALETELSDIKGMLSQLISISTPPPAQI